MATLNPFDLLDDDAEDPTELLALQQQKTGALASTPAQAKKGAAQAQPPAKSSVKLPSKPLPPSQAARESKNEGHRGGRGVGRGGRGGRGFNRDMGDNENAFVNTDGYKKPSDGGDASKAPYERRPYNGPRGGGGGFRGGRRSEFNNGESDEGGDRPRRTYDRHSGSGRGNEFIKREGAGRGNWGTPTDDIVPETDEIVNEEKAADSEKQSEQESLVKEEEEKEKEKQKEQEEKEMTLEEYEKIREEKRKALLALKSEERKVNLDKELEAMQLLSNKKNNDEIFAKLGSDKDKRKEAADKTKKSSVSINEFLKPAEGENFRAGGRGRGRGRGGRGGGFGGSTNNYVQITPTIEDVGQFPSLGCK